MTDETKNMNTLIMTAKERELLDEGRLRGKSEVIWDAMDEMELINSRRACEDVWSTLWGHLREHLSDEDKKILTRIDKEIRALIKKE